MTPPRASSAPLRTPRRGALRSTWFRRDRRSGYYFVAPSLLGFCVFVLGPVLYVFWLSFNSFDLLTGETSFIGLDNYRRMLADPVFRRVMVNTSIFAAGVVPLQLVIGLGLAMLINRSHPGIRLFRSVFFFPTLITLAAWAIVWNFLLQSDGGVNAVLGLLGVSGPNWLREAGWSMSWLVIVQVLKNVGVTMVLFLAALQGVPQELVEASRVDGANPWRSFRHVTLPLIAPFTFLILIHTTIASLKTFELIALLTGGGPGDATNVLVYHVYFVGFRLFEQGYASAMAVVLFVIILGVTVLQFGARRRWVHGER